MAIEAGQRVVLCGDHPWATYAGTVKENKGDGCLEIILNTGPHVMAWSGQYQIDRRNRRA